jgi:hypothetical protein
MGAVPTTLQPAIPPDATLRFELVSAGSAAFDKVLQLRSLVTRRPVAPACAIDRYSEHYVASFEGTVIGALRVTRAARGRLDCEEHFPPRLVSAYREQLTSASSFVAWQQVPRQLALARRLVEFAWQDQLPRGTRVDVINVHERAVTYYGQLGYELVAGSAFTHPRYGTPSRVMVFAARPGLPGPLAALFEAVDNPVRREDLLRQVELTPWQELRPQTVSAERIAN